MSLETRGTPEGDRRPTASDSEVSRSSKDREHELGVRIIDESAVPRILDDVAEWERDDVARFLAREPERETAFLTNSGRPVDRAYTPADVSAVPWEDVGLPGRYPFTRGPYPTMYRARLWTMRQIAGYGTPNDTNQRFRYLLEQGQTGLSVDFDMPTLMGYDSDDPRSFGEVGREGVAVDVLDDMEALFEGIDFDHVSISMTINPTAWILLAMYVVLAESRGYDLTRLSGTIQNDILKEYIAQKEWIYPIRPSLRIVRDTIVYGTEHLPRFNPINISGYHMSEAGALPIQEAAFTLANAKAYVEEIVGAGVDVDSFAPRLSFYFVAQADLFEEIAKFRAARRVYAKMMKEHFGAKNPESMRLRFHSQTAAATLTKAQPLNNIVRTALQALSAILGGAQSLHTNGFDEAYAIPTELAMKIALRTQQIIAYETNVPNTADPMGGSYYVEKLTSDFEEGIWSYLRKIDEEGGTVAAIERNFFQQEIADAAFDFAKRKASGQRPVVGVNRNVDTDEEQEITTHAIDPIAEETQIANLGRVKAGRDQARVTRALETLKIVATDGRENIMPATIEAVKARASVGEIVNELKTVFGTYVEHPVF